MNAPGGANRVDFGPFLAYAEQVREAKEKPNILVFAAGNSTTNGVFVPEIPVVSGSIFPYSFRTIDRGPNSLVQIAFYA